jgi:hypothetical protein
MLLDKAPGTRLLGRNKLAASVQDKRKDAESTSACSNNYLLSKVEASIREDWSCFSH